MRLCYTRRALADLDELLGYIRVQRAHRVPTRIKALIDLLLVHPYIGRRTTNPIFRRIVISPSPYLIFYQVNEDEIIIHVVRHAAPNRSTMPGAQ